MSVALNEKKKKTTMCLESGQKNLLKNNAVITALVAVTTYKQLQHHATEIPPTQLTCTPVMNPKRSLESDTTQSLQWKVGLVIK